MFEEGYENSSAKPSSQLLHNRAAESAKETRQSIITLSAGSLAVFFLALTSKIDPELSLSQKASVIVALICMALAIFSGLWSAYSDAQWSYYWAKFREEAESGTGKSSETKSTNWTLEVDRWHKHKRWSEKASILFFVAGVLVSSIYIALRAFNWSA